MKNYLLIGFLLIFAISCKKDDTETRQVQGTWIESVYKTDTIEFSSGSELLFLKRGKEMRDGCLLPKPRSGPYMYEIDKDSISLVWGFSSCLNSTQYYFDLDEKNNLIKIGNFFVDSLDRKNETLVFVRAD